MAPTVHRRSDAIGGASQEREDLIVGRGWLCHEGRRRGGDGGSAQGRESVLLGTLTAFQSEEGENRRPRFEKASG